LPVQEEFKSLSDHAFGVPAGALSGSQVLSSSGPVIPVRLIPAGAVAINLRQQFHGEGINQTRHRIWLAATAQVRMVLPILSKEIEVSVEVPITETVIVGPVPNSFYSGQVGGVTLPAAP
jgi:sporulation protein YunB